ncbi:MAG: aspartate-semialdehyde dehydrogenase [Actinobacteria bacterium]|jgi:aspartate-semialdehyde dehydrogenase|nr:aspartate-semialdehyde dehydrogenase [Actinomycetota bacterium]
MVLVGATGAVGTEVLRILEQRDFPVDELVPVASPRSVGRKLRFRGGDLEVVGLQQKVFEGADLAVFDVSEELSLEWAPVAAESGAVVIDKSAAFRMDIDVPLVVPEINADQVRNPPKGIIATPNCTTTAMVMPVAALHRKWTVNRLVLATYQAASGSGQPGVEELWEQTQLAVKEPDAVREGRAGDVIKGGDTFVHPIALNVIPKCGSVKDDGYTSEELKLCHETRKIMGLPDLKVTATCVRVPVVTGHGVAVHAEFDSAVSLEHARALLAEAPGIELADDVGAHDYPTPLRATTRDACYVGRIRRDLFDDRALEFFSVSDNLRKGAALNAVQIAELLI